MPDPIAIPGPPVAPRPRDLPLFRDHNIPWLAARLPYTENTLVAFKYGTKPMTPRFRATCAKVLRRSETELFGQPPGAAVPVSSPEEEAQHG